MNARNNPLVEKHIIRGVQWKYRISQNNYDSYFPAKESHVWFSGDHPADPNQYVREMPNSWKKWITFERFVHEDWFNKQQMSEQRRFGWNTDSVQKNRFTEMSPIASSLLFTFSRDCIVVPVQNDSNYQKSLNVSINTVKITCGTN